MRHAVSQSSSNSISPRSSWSASQLEALQQLDHLLANPPSRQSAVFGDVTLVDSTRDATALSESARREEGSRLLQDALRHRQPGRRLRIPRESSLRFETPTPPWSPVKHFSARLWGIRPGFDRQPTVFRTLLDLRLRMVPGMVVLVLQPVLKQDHPHQRLYGRQCI